MHAEHGEDGQELATTEVIRVMREQGRSDCQLSNQSKILYQLWKAETLGSHLGSYRCDQLPQANVPGTLSNRQLNHQAVRIKDK